MHLLLTSDPESYSVLVSSPLGSSDHCLVKSLSLYSPPVQGPRDFRRLWRYGSADWSFLASYPRQHISFSSGDPSVGTWGQRRGYIPSSDPTMSGQDKPWFGPECARAEALKHEAYLAWVDARDRKANDVQTRKELSMRLSIATREHYKTLDLTAFAG